MAWTTIGYHAFEQRCFDELTLQDCAGNYHMDISPMRWSASPLSAISYTRKEAARKLGATLTDSHEATPVKGKGLKSRGGKLDIALESPNYVIWRLQTQENVAEQVAKGIIKPLHEHKGFDMHQPFQPFVPLALPGKWKVDLV